MKTLKLLFLLLLCSNFASAQEPFDCADHTLSTLVYITTDDQTCEATIRLIPKVSPLRLNKIRWQVLGGFTSEDQTIIIPLCEIDGQSLDISLLVAFEGSPACFYSGQLPVNSPCMEDCEVPNTPTDCQASFVAEYDVENCRFNFANTSTASAANDCGECLNPSGIVSTTWRLKDLADGSPGIGTLNLVNYGFHFSFRPKDYPVQYGYQLCLTIVDCSGCETTYCDFLEDRLPTCPEFTGNPEEGFLDYRKNDQDNASSDFSLYPNPTSNEVYIDLTNTNEASNQSEILVYDLQGKQIQTINTTKAEREQLDVSNWATGTYLFVLKRNGKVIQTKKLNVQAH